MKVIKKLKKPVPDFKNRAEMAKWFDTHDMTDYDFKPVNVTFELEKPKEETVMFRLDKGIKQYLTQVARKKGLNTSSLLRMWVMEKFHQLHGAA